MSSPTTSEGLLAIGEIRTGFLHHSTEITLEEASDLLRLIPGEQVRYASRPRPYAVSPETLTGVDCTMPSARGRRVRGVGTVASRVTLTGGRVLQSCAYTTLVPSERGHRLPWSHYLGRPGAVEYLGRLEPDDAAAGFAEAEDGARGIGLGAIAEQAMNGVQASALLDGGLPLRAPRGSWRWAFQDGGSLFRFTVVPDGTRLVRLAVPGGRVDDLLDLVEDLALHDWLLGTVETILERAAPGSGSTDRMLRNVRPLIGHILHHWMPAARVRPELLPLWEALDRVHGLTRQWDISVDRVRDQLAVDTVTMLVDTVALLNDTVKMLGQEKPVRRRG
ncbi:SCO2521 family protein [Actinocorallia populi]|uniref:SCO2521 family protein n=1 Tax=Actinocorallia populi TaxID=2079200 RepID=UPI000D096937|nr:SCO2521 family protein [Actinocorallia populi]